MRQPLNLLGCFTNWRGDQDLQSWSFLSKPSVSQSPCTFLVTQLPLTLVLVMKSWLQYLFLLPGIWLPFAGCPYYVFCCCSGDKPELARASPTSDTGFSFWSLQKLATECCCSLHSRNWGPFIKHPQLNSGEQKCLWGTWVTKDVIFPGGFS